MPTTINYANRSCGDILKEIRDTSSTPRELGTKFEQLFLVAAPLIPELEINNVMTWADWRSDRGLGGQDDGIDLVAETTSGANVAIQCKCLSDNVSKGHIKDFIAALGPAEQNDGGGGGDFPYDGLLPTVNAQHLP